MKNFLMLACSLVLLFVTGCKNAEVMSDEEILARCAEQEANHEEMIYVESSRCREAHENHDWRNLDEQCAKHEAHASELPETCGRRGKNGRSEYAPLFWTKEQFAGTWENCRVEWNPKCSGMGIQECLDMDESPFPLPPSWCPSLD